MAKMNGGWLVLRITAELRKMDTALVDSREGASGAPRRGGPGTALRPRKRVSTEHLNIDDSSCWPDVQSNFLSLHPFLDLSIPSSARLST